MLLSCSAWSIPARVTGKKPLCCTQTWSTRPDNQPQPSHKPILTCHPLHCPLHAHTVCLATFSPCAPFWKKHLFQAFRVSTVSQHREIPRQHDWNKVTSILQRTLVPEAQPGSPMCLPDLRTTFPLQPSTISFHFTSPGQSDAEQAGHPHM